MLEQRELFAGLPLRPELTRERDAGVDALADLSDDELLALDEDAWLDEIVGLVRRDVPRLDRVRASIEHTAPTGEIVLAVPFQGTVELFDAQLALGLIEGRHARSRPRAEVGDGVVRCALLPAEGDTADALAGACLDELERWLALLARTLDEFYVEVRERAATELRARRAEVERVGAFLRGTKLPICPRPDAPGSYAESGIRRRRTPLAARRRGARRSAAPVVAGPRPVMELELYEHIVRVIRAAGNGMSRAPRTYEKWGEEDRRQALLLMLNSHYEGRAVAEAFNGNGKTDILVRVDDVDVFIAECKFWGGRRSGERTVDQLLGYTTWHDTRLAIVFFVRARGFQAVIDEGREMLEGHDRFARWAAQAPPVENELRCFVRIAGDDAREAMLHVFFIHTPPAT